MHTFVLFYWVTLGLFVVGLRYTKKVVHSKSQLVHLTNEIDIVYIGAVETEVGSVFSFSVAVIALQN